MKVKRFTERNTGLSFNYHIANVDDLISLKNNNSEKINNYKDIFKVKREKRGHQLAKEMFTDMMEMMADDMIEKNCAVSFPYLDFGYMVVTDNSKNIDNVTLDVFSEGRAYVLKMVFSRKVLVESKRKWLGRFNEVNRIRILDRVRTGHKY